MQLEELLMGMWWGQNVNFDRWTRFGVRMYSWQTRNPNKILCTPTKYCPSTCFRSKITRPILIRFSLMCSSIYNDKQRLLSIPCLLINYFNTKWNLQNRCFQYKINTCTCLSNDSFFLVKQLTYSYNFLILYLFSVSFVHYFVNFCFSIKCFYIIIYFC